MQARVQLANANAAVAAASAAAAAAGLAPVVGGAGGAERSGARDLQSQMQEALQRELQSSLRGVLQGLLSEMRPTAAAAAFPPFAEAPPGHSLGAFLSLAPAAPGAIVQAMGASASKRAVVLGEFGPAALGGRLVFGMPKDGVDLRWWAPANAAPMVALLRGTNVPAVALRDLGCVVSAFFILVKEAKMACPSTSAAWQGLAMEFCFALAGEACNEIVDLARCFEKAEPSVFEAVVATSFDRVLERARATDGLAPRVSHISAAQIASDLREILASMRATLLSVDPRGRVVSMRSREERRASPPRRTSSPRRASPPRRGGNGLSSGPATGNGGRRDRPDRSGRGCSAWYFGAGCSRGCPPESHQCLKARCIAAQRTDHVNAACPERDRRG